MAWFNTKYGQDDTKDRTASFVHNRTRENIKSGEKHSTIFGKIARYFEDLKLVAFTGSYNDLNGKPSAFPPAAHRHSKSDITDFPSSLPASDVHAWAKAASKPSYTAGEVGALPASGGTITGGLSAGSDLSSGGNIIFGGGAFMIGKGYYSGNYHVANFWDGVNEAGVGFTSTSKGDCGLHPHADGAGSLGKPYRWNQVYATNSSISTSDRNEKEEISYIGKESEYKDTYITDEQIMQLISGLKPVVFKRKNGESGRPHHGIIAQDFEELLKEIGLHDHAAFIKSPKMVEIEEEIEKEVKKEIPQEDGTVKVVTEKIKEKTVRQEEVPGEYVYGIRYEELKGDLIRFCQIIYNRLEVAEDTGQEQQKKFEGLEDTVRIQEKKIKDLEDRVKKFEELFKTCMEEDTEKNEPEVKFY